MGGVVYGLTQGDWRRGMKDVAKVSPHSWFMSKEQQQKFDVGGSALGVYDKENAKAAAKKAQANLINSANALYAGQRQRQRASALSTGAGPSGSSPVTSAMAYGKPTLGG